MTTLLRFLRPRDVRRSGSPANGTSRVPVLGAVASGAGALATALSGSANGDGWSPPAQPGERGTRASLPERQPEDEVWGRVQLARDPARPHTRELVREMGGELVELHGDRLFRDDPAIVGGLARIGRRAVVIVGHQKGSDTSENIRRNFGMPHPEGYRKAQRLFALAERFGLPVLTIVDTPGAFPGPASEERGVAEAIARSIRLLSGLRTPIVTVISGEGGSGGALAIAVGDTVLALENATYSVISPEGCASILWRSSEAARTAAAAMRMTASEQVLLGVVDAVVAEPVGGVQRDPATTGRLLRDAVSAAIAGLEKLPLEDLLAARYRRYRELGTYRTVEGAPGVHVPERPTLAGRLRQLIDAGVGRIGASVDTVAGGRTPTAVPADAGPEAPLHEDV